MKINDLVLLINPMQSYSGYYTFFEKNNLPIDVASRYVYFESPKYLDVYRVLYSIAETDSNKVVIEEVGMARRVYIVDEKAFVTIGRACDNYSEITAEYYNGWGLEIKKEE